MKKCSRLLLLLSIQFASSVAFTQPHSFAAPITNKHVKSDTFAAVRPNNTPGIHRRSALNMLPALNIMPAVTSFLSQATVVLTSPTVKALALANILPTCIGYYKVEYGVSYAYGTATAASAYLALQTMLEASASPFAAVAKLHALAIIFYGVRLNLFLGWREFFNQRFRRMRERIEARQKKKEKGAGLFGRILNRTPFILSCSMLYAGLASPALSSANLIKTATIPSCPYALLAYKTLVGMTWFGFLLAAVGDFQKSASKARNGSDHLVTNGVYSLFRHPNYTGECIGWGSSFLASIVAMIGTKSLDVAKSVAPYLTFSSLGVFGIFFVLMMAATNLETRQEEKYGTSPEYKAWIESSWAGPTLKK